MWGAYAFLAAGFTALAIYDIAIAVIRPPGRSAVIPELTVGFQYMIGLLLLCVVASTSLAEERARGSLDVLMTTPLSTREILWGKWAGAYRLVLRLALMPAIVGLPLAVWNFQIHRFVLLIGLFLAYGTAVTSMAIAAATWVSRPGRAIGLCVSIYVLSSLGLLFLAIYFNSEEVVMGMPLYGGIFGIVGLRDERAIPSRVDNLLSAYMLFWSLVHVGIGIFLFQATLASFDRCLGRVPARED